jgi:hypothetical protein
MCRAIGAREIYVHYRDGIGRSKLSIPAARDGTARNMNTVAKLAAVSGHVGEMRSPVCAGAATPQEFRRRGERINARRSVIARSDREEMSRHTAK